MIIKSGFVESLRGKWRIFFRKSILILPFSQLTFESLKILSNSVHTITITVLCITAVWLRPHAGPWTCAPLQRRIQRQTEQKRYVNDNENDLHSQHRSIRLHLSFEFYLKVAFSRNHWTINLTWTIFGLKSSPKFEFFL